MECAHICTYVCLCVFECGMPHWMPIKLMAHTIKQQNQLVAIEENKNDWFLYMCVYTLG